MLEERRDVLCSLLDLIRLLPYENFVDRGSKESKPLTEMLRLDRKVHMLLKRITTVRLLPEYH